MAAQSLWRQEGSPSRSLIELIELDLAQVEPSVAGPHQPHQRQSLAAAGASFHQHVKGEAGQQFFAPSFDAPLTLTITVLR